MSKGIFSNKLDSNICLNKHGHAKNTALPIVQHFLQFTSGFYKAPCFLLQKHKAAEMFGFPLKELKTWTKVGISEGTSSVDYQRRFPLCQPACKSWAEAAAGHAWMWFVLLAAETPETAEAETAQVSLNDLKKELKGGSWQQSKRSRCRNEIRPSDMENESTSTLSIEMEGHRWYAAGSAP